MKRSILRLLAMVALATCLATADVPNLISYQGELTDSEGNPLDGTYDLTFAIYESQEAEEDLWSEQHLSVEVTEGLITVSLGSGETFPADLFDEPERWLGITVGTEDELTPRIRFQSTPYSHKSKASDLSIEADRVDGYEGEDLEESAEIDDDISIHAAEYGHLTHPQAEELTSGGFTMLHNHSFVPPENIFRFVGYVDNWNTIFTVPSDKILFITAIHVWSTYSPNITIMLGTDDLIAIHRTMPWISGGAPFFLGPNESISGFGGAKITITGYEFDYEP